MDSRNGREVLETTRVCALPYIQAKCSSATCEDEVSGEIKMISEGARGRILARMVARRRDDVNATPRNNFAPQGVNRRTSIDDNQGSMISTITDTAGKLLHLEKVEPGVLSVGIYQWRSTVASPQRRLMQCPSDEIEIRQSRARE